MPSTDHHSQTSAELRVVDLRRRFGQLEVLRGVAIDFRPGRTTVVLGPSGCGKSVMLKHLVGLLRPDSGEVYFDDTRIDTLSERQLAPIRQQVGFLFQQSALFDSMSVRQNVAFPLVEHSTMSDLQRERRVREVLDMVGLGTAINQMPAELSGGQRKRIALARAIALEPRVVLYDEPTTGLDPIRSDVINELILRLQHDLGITSIVVTHDLTTAFTVADDMVMMYDGQVILRGSPAAFRASDDPIVRRFLAGEATAEELAGRARTPSKRHDAELQEA